MSKVCRIAAISFDQPHMEQLLGLVQALPGARIVSLCDANPDRLKAFAKRYGVDQDLLFEDADKCLSRAEADLVIACPAAGARVQLIETIASHDVAVLLDKPFAANAAQAGQIADLLKGRIFAVNWPLAFYPEHVATKRMIDEGTIGEVTEVHYFGGNRGPIFNRDAGRDASPDEKSASWWYDRGQGGGSLSDYLGYGVTLGAWFMGGRTPTEVTTVTDAESSESVDTHSVTIARFSTGLSTYRTRWGTLTDPWITQTQPKSGYVVVGRSGSIASYDYTGVIELQTSDQMRTIQAPPLGAPHRNVVEHVLNCIETGQQVGGPCSAELSLLGQRIMDAASESASRRAAVAFR